MNKTINILLFTIFIFVLYSCSIAPIPQKDKAFTDLLHAHDVNKSMTLALWIIDDINNLHIGDSIDLAAKNNTKNNIVFASDDWVRILTFDKSTNKWIDIPNLMNYFHGNKQILFPETEASEGIFGFSVYPSINNIGQPIEIRIVIFGDTKDFIPFIRKQVEAYIDLTMQP